MFPPRRGNALKGKNTTAKKLNYAASKRPSGPHEHLYVAQTGGSDAQVSAERHVNGARFQQLTHDWGNDDITSWTKFETRKKS